MQEFAFADCVTKTKINSIYNSHSHGSVLWYLFGLDAVVLWVGAVVLWVGAVVLWVGAVVLIWA